MVLANNIKHLHFAIFKSRNYSAINAWCKRRYSKIMPKLMRNLFCLDGAIASDGR